MASHLVRRTNRKQAQAVEWNRVAVGIKMGNETVEEFKHELKMF